MSTRHYSPESDTSSDPVACGGTGYNYGSVTDRSLVTCKRCLASLAKRDREFQRKARAFILDRQRRHRIVIVAGDPGPYEAAEAIAAEETARGTPLGHMQLIDASMARFIAREEGRA